MAYIKDEEIEIVKRIETPRRGEEVEEEILYTNEVVTQNIEYQEEEEALIKFYQYYLELQLLELWVT